GFSVVTYERPLAIPILRPVRSLVLRSFPTRRSSDLRIQMTPRLVIYLAKSMAAQTRHGAQIQQNASCGVSVQAMAGGRRIYAPGSRMAPRWSSVATPWTLMNGMRYIASYRTH